MIYLYFYIPYTIQCFTENQKKKFTNTKYEFLADTIVVMIIDKSDQGDQTILTIQSITIKQMGNKEKKKKSRHPTQQVK